MQQAILIPALKPDQKLTSLVESLIRLGFAHIIIVNDGSPVEYDGIFSELDTLPQVHLLKHAINLGKGRGLKTGFNYYLNQNHLWGCSGIITADADGQHSPEDIAAVAKKMDENAKALVLGVRDFDHDNVPWRSRAGNKITRFTFRLLIGPKLVDTQTGLRGLPNHSLPIMLEVFGERFDYELGMLIACKQHNIAMVETPIQTIYIDDNKSSHFRNFADSFKIYRLLLKQAFRYIFSSLLSWGVDIGIFALLYSMLAGKVSMDLAIVISTIVARVCSVIINYMINKNLVFSRSHKGSVVKFLLLAVFVMLVSMFSVDALTRLTGLNVVVVKCIVDAILFIFNFFVQREFIFKEERKKGE